MVSCYIVFTVLNAVQTAIGQQSLEIFAIDESESDLVISRVASAAVLKISALAA